MNCIQALKLIAEERKGGYTRRFTGMTNTLVDTVIGSSLFMSFYSINPKNFTSLYHERFLLLTILIQLTLISQPIQSINERLLYIHTV